MNESLLARQLFFSALAIIIPMITVLVFVRRLRSRRATMDAEHACHVVETRLKEALRLEGKAIFLNRFFAEVANVLIHCEEARGRLELGFVMEAIRQELLALEGREPVFEDWRIREAERLVRRLIMEDIVR